MLGVSGARAVSGAVRALFISGFRKCAKVQSTLDFVFSTLFYINLYFVKDKCHGNCHMHEETIKPLGLVVSIK